MSANPPARLEDEFCISCERMLLLPIWGGVFEGDFFAVSINGRSLLIFVVAHGVRASGLIVLGGVGSVFGSQEPATACQGKGASIFPDQVTNLP